MGEHKSTTLAVLLALTVLLGFISVVYGQQCNGKCVPLDKCKDSNFGGTNFFDVRVGRDDEDEAVPSECEFYLHVCCNDVIEDVTERINQPATEDLKGDNAPDYQAVFEQCGTRNEEGAGFRITHATDETEFGEFPWMVALFVEQDHGSGDKNYICGGSLIKPNVVMTAAHCVFNRTGQTLIVRAGEWDTNTEAEVRPYQEQPVARIILHENFKIQFLHHDVAILVLEKPFQADEHVQLICLPPSDLPFDEENCFATGWGKSRFDSPQYQIILKKVEVPVVQHNECQQALRKTRLGPHFTLHNSFMCAGGEAGVDACTGDGGSPLVCPIPDQVNRYQQAGIVAWGIGCGQPGVPGVYVKSSLYTDWIEEKLEEFNMNDGQW